MEIVNIFYELARTHTSVRTFMYDKSYEKGSGVDRYPMVWLDDPILATSAGPVDNALRYTVNVDILGMPAHRKDVQIIQGAAQHIGLSFREQLRKAVYGTSVESFNFITLRDYTDDDVAGVRFTFVVVMPNPVNLCADPYDPAKQLIQLKDLPDFSVENPDGCAVFNNKSGLPNFSVTE